MNSAVHWVRDRTGGDYINVVIIIITEKIPNAATNGFVPSHWDSGDMSKNGYWLIIDSKEIVTSCTGP